MDQSLDEHINLLVEPASQISPNHIYLQNNTEKLQNKRPKESAQSNPRKTQMPKTKVFPILPVQEKVHGHSRTHMSQ